MSLDAYTVLDAFSDIKDRTDEFIVKNNLGTYSTKLSSKDPRKSQLQSFAMPLKSWAVQFDQQPLGRSLNVSDP